MKKLVLFALACSLFTACGGGGSDSGFSLSDISPPALGKVNLILENLESSSLSEALFSTTGENGNFTNLLPSATLVKGRFVIPNQNPATYTFKYKFANGITSPPKTSTMAANTNVQMAANTTNTGTVSSTAVSTSSSSSSSTSSTSSSSSSSGTFTTPSGYTCSDATGSLGSRCSYIKSCVSNTGSGGFYQTNLGQYNFTLSQSSITAAATAAVNACQ